MARRRLLTILATTVAAVGLTTGPVMAQDLAGLTSTVEDSVTSTTDSLSSTTEDVVDTLTGGALQQDTATGDDPESEPEASPSASEDDALIDLGTDDGTLDVELDVDLAPSDEDGSPQLEVDGGATIGGQEIDLGGATDPIEDAIDPDPAPSPSEEPTGGTDAPSTPRADGPGGFLSGGGVVAAGNDPRPVDDGSTPTGSSLEGVAAWGALDRGSFGLQRYGGGTMQLDRVAGPEVAPPLASAPQGAEALDELPDVAQERTPAVLATQGPGGGDDSPLVAALRALAAALVLATGAAWTRATKDA